LTNFDFIFGTLAVLLIIEGTRRSLGWALPAVALVFLAYAFAGPYLPGILTHRGYPIEMVLDELYLTTEGIFGVAASASATFVFMFILFGAFLENTRIGQFFISLAFAITGGMKGGPAKTAVVASGLMGMVSGSGIGNVATTGTFTIPLMKKMGFQPHIAGAIEAAASTGGQIMPPIMGAAAFIMTEFTGTSYFEIIKLAFIPGLLYFFMVIMQVHFRAHKRNVRVIPKEELPSIRGILKDGWYLFIPILVLIVLLVKQYTPLFAATCAIFAAIIVSLFDKKDRMTLAKLFEALTQGAKAAAPIAMACACAGIVVGVLTLTGLGMKFSSLIVSGAGGNLFIGMVLVGITAFILGMGLPVVAAYVVLAVLGAPALCELGVPILAAHLIVMWFTQTSNITPPVCLAAFTAAGIAGSDPMRTGFASIRFGIGLFAIPFLFAYSPILTGFGFNFGFLQTVITATIGIVVVSAAIEGYLRRPMGIIERIILGVAGIMLVWPDFIVSIIGLVIALISYMIQIKTKPSEVSQGYGTM
ncbi:MAG: TRAP transporter permease, partial [Bacillota bacterium]